MSILLKKYLNVTVLLIAILISNRVIAQENILVKVSYKSSQLIYLRLNQKVEFVTGDTLYVNINKVTKPALIVKHVSYSSIAAVPIIDEPINIGDVFFKIQKKILRSDKSKDKLEDNNSLNNENIYLKDTIPRPLFKEYPKKKKKISGRTAIQSYSNYSNSAQGSSDQSWRALLSLNTNEISDKVSFSTYSILMKNSSNPYFRDQIRIYDMSLKYKFNEATNIILGRSINKQLTNINTIDGLQFETKHNSYLLGLFVGSRPDYKNNGFNANLLGFGAYISRADKFKNSKLKNTISIIEQENKFKTDRRFIYYQNEYSNYKYNIRFILSTEWDLFEKENNVKKSVFNFSNLYFNLSYDPVKWLSTSLFYDSRKQIILYETYENLEEILLNNYTRETINWSVYIKPIKYLALSLRTGAGMQKNDAEKSENFLGSISYSKIPLINAGAVLNYSKYKSSYSDGTVLGLKINKYIPSKKINLSPGYRFAKYEYLNAETIRQNILSMDLYYTLASSYILTVSYEGIFESERKFTRLLFELSYRF
tara:strand:+ start:21507 stop:23120 length:1614 start_codon:yes stop_codon:yes gene_type:complete